MSHAMEIDPSEKDSATTTLEKRLWDAADHFRANSCLKPQEYSGSILGLMATLWSWFATQENQQLVSQNTAGVIRLCG
jgi:hypothetical protein